LFEHDFFGKPVSTFPNHALKPLSNRLGAKIDTLKKLRILIRHAKDDLKWIAFDPCEGWMRDAMTKAGLTNSWSVRVACVSSMAIRAPPGCDA
jgi:hypothetical protein